MNEAVLATTNGSINELSFSSMGADPLFLHPNAKLEASSIQAFSNSTRRSKPISSSESEFRRGYREPTIILKLESKSSQ